jgi:hypothetical protein
MIFFIRYLEGQGGTALYTRLRNAAGYFWDFGYLGWTDTEANSCKLYLAESDDGDSVESLYSAEGSVPAGGPWIEEVVRASDGRVIGYDYVTAAVENVALTLKQLLYSYVGDAANVFSKISGSFIGQVNFYAASYADFAASPADPGGTLVCTLSSTGVMSNTTNIATDGDVLYFKLSETPTAFEALADTVINIYSDANKGNVRVYVPNGAQLVAADYVYYPTSQGGLLVYENGNIVQFAETAWGKAIGMIPNINWERISQPVVLTTTSVID